MRRSGTFSLLPLTALLLPVIAAADKEPIKETVYKTPTEVFEAQQAAMSRNDFRAVMHCYTREGQLATAASLAYVWLTVTPDAERKADLKEEFKTYYRGIRDLLDRHGLTKEATKAIKPGLTDKEKERSVAELAKLIRDPVKLWVEMKDHNYKFGVKLGVGTAP